MNWYLTFSDSAKFAQSALYLLSNQRTWVTHAFFTPQRLSQTIFPAEFSPLPSLLMTLPIKILGLSDFSIILGGHTILILTCLCLFYAGYKISGKLTASISVLIFLIIPGIWEYYWNFSSEAVAMFFLSLSIAFLVKNKLKLTVPTLLLAIISRPQLICLPLAYLLTKRKYLLSLLIVVVIGIFGFTYHQAFVSLNFASSVPQGEYLRGREVTPLPIPKLISKTFYNVYNFTKSPERIVPIGILIVTLLGFNQISQFTIVSTILLVIMASLTIPNARYIHPILPFYVLSFANNLPKKLWSSLIIIILLIPFIGKYTLDQRHVQKLSNTPVYKQIAAEMARNLPQGELIVTNLDAWAAWYHGLTTMWFPVVPEMLSPHPPKYIVITNYLENDADFALGPWHEVVYSPDHLQNEFLTQHYQILKTFTVNPDQIYEKQTYQGTILIRKP